MGATVLMLVNLNKVILQLDNVEKELRRKAAMECGYLVEARAKEICPRDTGELANSINTQPLGNEEVGVGTNLTYGYFVHEGTGIYNPNTTRPGGVYWVYIKTPGHSYESYKETNSGKSKSYATLEEARQVVAILRSKGLDAFYTNGQKPQPFLTNALQDTQGDFPATINEIIKEAL